MVLRLLVGGGWRLQTSQWTLSQTLRAFILKSIRDADDTSFILKVPMFSHWDLPRLTVTLTEQEAEERLPKPLGPEDTLTVLLLLHMGCNPLLPRTKDCSPLLAVYSTVLMREINNVLEN